MSGAVRPSDVPQGSVRGQRQDVLLPQVRYHPSIQAAGARPNPNRTRTGQTQRAGPAAVRPLQTGKRQVNVKVKVVQNPQSPDRESDHDPVGTASADPDQASDRTSPRPEDVPQGLDVKMDPAQVKEVEVLTRGQRENQHWFSWRRNRITASVAHQIARSRFANGSSQTPPSSYLKAITGEGARVQTRAMSWGVKMEAQAVRVYQKMKSAALGVPVRVQACGLFVDPVRPWLAASPDGLVTDSRTGRRWCLEVKCPHKHRDGRVEDACRTDPAFCLEIRDHAGPAPPGAAPAYRLKRSHSYFTQIQCQLAVTGLREADLVVFTLKETAIVPVTFDPEQWEETVSKLEVFYRDAVLPHLRRTEERRAAQRPEP